MVKHLPLFSQWVRWVTQSMHRHVHASREVRLRKEVMLMILKK